MNKFSTACEQRTKFADYLRPPVYSLACSKNRCPIGSTVTLTCTDDTRVFAITRPWTNTKKLECKVHGATARWHPTFDSPRDYCQQSSFVQLRMYGTMID